MRFAVVSPDTQKVVAFFATREQADRYIADVRLDDEETAERLRIEVVDLEADDRE